MFEVDMEYSPSYSYLGFDCGLDDAGLPANLSVGWTFRKSAYQPSYCRLQAEWNVGQGLFEISQVKRPQIWT